MPPTPDDDERAEAERRIAASAEALRRRAEQARRELEQMSDWELIGDAHGPAYVMNPMELNRRLMESVRELTGELVKFRASSDSLATQLLRYTVALFVLTGALAILTVILVVKAI